MIKDRLIGADGLVHLSSKQGDPPKTEADPERIAQANQKKDVCLN